MFSQEKFRFEILSVLSMRFPPSVRISLPRSYNVLIFRRRGDAELYGAEGETVKLCANDITFVPPNYKYRIASLTNEDVTIIHFNADIKNGKEFKNLHSVNPARFEYLFEKALSCWNKKPLGFAYLIDSVFCSILAELEIQCAEEYSTSVEISVRKAIDEMRLSLSDADFTVEKAAKLSGYSSSYFRRIFRQITGQSPLAYLISIRIDR
ncbi:MAG: AraC family transcriptional regulator, partial [Clostridia bacterium]|nr:AraC family transcriptional regulator [Clostridia bacterium]